MARKYDVDLVRNIKEKQYVETLREVEVIVKPIPDCDIKGAMDPRALKAAVKKAGERKTEPKSKNDRKEITIQDIERLRETFNAIDSTPVVTEGVTIKKRMVLSEDGYKIPLTIFKGKKPDTHSPVLYYIHGGGFFAGRTEVVSEALKLFVIKTNMIVVSVDYRLAPENPFPVGHEDCYTGLKWLFHHAEELAIDEKNIFVGGDSAGGNITLYCSNRAIEEQLDLIKGQILLYPTVNLGGIKDEYTEYTVADFEIYEKHKEMITPQLIMMAETGKSLGGILGTSDIKNKYLTPYSDVSAKMPPTFISSGEHDSLTIESLAYARKLRLQGVDIQYTLYKGLGHAYFDHVGNYPQAEDCVEDIGEFIKHHIAE